MNNEYVFQIIITPRDGTTGANLIRLLNALQVCVRWRSLVVVDVECNGDRSWAQRRPFRATTDELVTYAQGVGQFDWASFFFEARSGQLADCADYGTLFAQAPLVVRAVDDTYFYVYSQEVEDVERLSNMFSIQFSKQRRAEVVHPT